MTGMTHVWRTMLGATCLAVTMFAPVAWAQPPSAPNLARSPALGVSCPRQNACGRVGVAVWVTRRARSVTVAVLGRRIELTTSHHGSGAYGYRKYWTGFVRLRPRDVKPGSHPRVHITIFGHGTATHATRAVYLAAGWG